MHVTTSPSPCTPGVPYHITVTGGVPPYYFSPGAVPPNPPGVEVEVLGGGVARVTVPPGTPSGAVILVMVSDNLQPLPNTAVSKNRVA